MLSASGFSPLSVAAAGNHEAVCSILLSAGAELDAAGEDGNTPLYHAAAGCHLETAKMLLGARANPRCKNAAGVSIIDLAMRLRDEEMVSAC